MSSTNYELSSTFQNAAAYLSSASSLTRVSAAVKLELYGLFKYLTSSRLPTSSRPSIFDMTARAKWDAWARAGKGYEQPEEVEKRYLEIARTLGWTEQTKLDAKEDSTPPTSSNYDDLWDEDGGPSSKTSGAGGGMGLSVSSMVPPPKVVDSSIHGLALADDISGLTTLLDRYPETDLNALDEFGYAPIHLACDRGNVEIVKLLLTRGADRNIKDPDNLTPLELSKEAGHPDIEYLLEPTP